MYDKSFPKNWNWVCEYVYTQSLLIWRESSLCTNLCKPRGVTTNVFIRIHIWSHIFEHIKGCECVHEWVSECVCVCVCYRILLSVWTSFPYTCFSPFDQYLPHSYFSLRWVLSPITPLCLLRSLLFSFYYIFPTLLPPPLPRPPPQQTLTIPLRPKLRHHRG